MELDDKSTRLYSKLAELFYIKDDLKNNNTYNKLVEDLLENNEVGILIQLFCACKLNENMKIHQIYNQIYSNLQLVIPIVKIHAQNIENSFIHLKNDI